MAKIKIFIVTYNRAKDLHNNLLSLFSSDLENHTIEVNIINNHSNFRIDTSFEDKVKIYHNYLRPDFSTGHLARDWNSALVNGFKNLQHPDADLVIHYQDDTVLEPNWLIYLLDLHNSFDFIQMGIGDQLCSYLPEGVKKVGLWEERLCSIGYQDADYFIRQLVYNRAGTCINDHQHGRLLNCVNFSICKRPEAPNIFSDDHRKAMVFHPMNERIFKLKWPNVPPNYWTPELFHHPPVKSNIQNFIFYPYFENDIYDLAGKNFIV